MSRRARHLRRASAVLAAFTLFACADDSGTAGPDLSASCGIITCAAPDDSDPNIDGIKIDNEIGKADAVDRVQTALADLTTDGVLSLDEVDALYDAAGGKVSVGEIRAIRDALNVDANSTYSIDDDALAEARFRAFTANLSDVETDYLRDGYTCVDNDGQDGAECIPG